MYAFPKSARLRHSREFRETLNGGVKTVCSQVVLFAHPQTTASPEAASEGARVGLIVSRKVGEAVVRTRVKRHLREAFRYIKPELDQVSELKDMDLVVIARPSAAAASGVEIADALRHCLMKMSRQIRANRQGPHDQRV